jgi:tetratricopeptide (TPR) repeat protein
MKRMLKGKGNHSTNVVVSEDTTTPHRLFRRRLIVVVTCVVLMLAAIGGAYALWHSGKKTKGDPSTKQTIDSSPNAQAVNDSIANGDYQAAEDTLKNSPELQNTRDGLMFTASVQFEKGSYADAVKTYQEVATKYGWTSNVAERIARCYAELKNKDQAISYYNKAIELLDKENSPMKESDKQVYRRQIEALQK